MNKMLGTIRIDSDSTILVTGAAGFIGFHLCLHCLSLGATVIGVDNFNDYYAVSLKRSRSALLHSREKYIEYEVDVENESELFDIFRRSRPDFVIHLAAQAGVRYSIQNPRAYLNANIVGTFNVIQAVKRTAVKHFLIASTSSVYGASTAPIFREVDKADNQISFYAATKKATEMMAHSFSHLDRIPTTVFRFFTVYGPWGRPDMALQKFAKLIREGEPIDVYNMGDMTRDFTYIDDLIGAVVALAGAIPGETPLGDFDSLSPVAPFRTVNIGSNAPARLNQFIDVLGAVMGKPVIKNLMPMQQGDVQSTHADTTLLKQLIGEIRRTPLETGVANFVEWFEGYYD